MFRIRAVLLPPAPSPSTLLRQLMHTELFETPDVITEIFGSPEPIISEEASIVAFQEALDLESAIAQRPGNTFSYTEKVAMLKSFAEHNARKDYEGHLRYFPSEGALSYHAYPKHIEFLNLGATHRERMFMAGNRVGKSIAGGYEMACHVTGIYPEWWAGKRFDHPVDCWGAGDTSQTTRDIVQLTLLGPPGDWGTGLLPKRCIPEGGMRMRPGVPEALDSVKVIHASGGISKIGFKSYDQKRRAFQGTSRHVIWLDEEPPMDVYGECLIRTMTTKGVVYVTFTPLMGITPFVQEFLDAARLGGQIPY